MKFARYLEENVVVEWAKAYIDYRGLKRLIKQVDARYKARISLDLSRQSSQSASVHTFSTAVEGIRRRNRRVEAGNGSGDEASDTPIWSTDRQGAAPTADGTTRRLRSVAFDHSDEIEDRLPKIDLKSTGLKLEEEEEEEAHPSEPSNATHAGSSGDTQAAHEDAGISEPPETNQTDDGPDVNGGARHVDMQRGKSQQSIFERLRRSGSDDKDETLSPKKRAKRAKRKERNEAELTDIIDSSFDQQERIFFRALDSELHRIVKFYMAREQDMAKRYEMLARQLEELADHRREYKATHPSTAGETLNDLGLRLSHFVSPIRAPAETFKRASMQQRRSGEYKADSGKERADSSAKPKGHAAERVPSDPKAAAGTFDEGDRRRVNALSKMLNVYGGTLSETEDEELRKANRLAAMSHDPERYKVARKKLKTAILEYYRGLEILKNYKILNRTGFTKILKKFEKTTGVHCADAYYHTKVAPSVLVASETVEKLLKGTEEIYTAYFEHGVRKRALERLRVNNGANPDHHLSTHHLSTTRTGFYLGVTVCATVAGLVEAMHDDILSRIPLWDQLMRVYGAELLPTVFALLFGINLAVWHQARVNAIFIFEFDVRNVLDYHQFFELPAFLLLLLSLCFWVSFLDPFPQAIAPTTWPLVWLVAVLVIMLNPLRFGYYHARRWMVFSLARVFHGGLLASVEFRDFFLGDELNSLNWSISMLWFFGCQYKHSWAYPSQCDPNKTFWTAALLALPATLRLLQCFRRWYDSKFTANLHLVNAGKYTSSILHYYLYINYRYHGSRHDHHLAIWAVFASIYTIYTSAWDITMDWSLLQRHARYPLLRNELVYESYWPFYYFAMVSNVIGRAGWTIYLMPGPASNLTRIFVIATIEMLRRWQWNFLRLENEHLGNVDMYRVSREVPLPYSMRSRDRHTDDDEENAIGTTSGLDRLRKLVQGVKPRDGDARAPKPDGGYPPSSPGPGTTGKGTADPFSDAHPPSMPYRRSTGNGQDSDASSDSKPDRADADASDQEDGEGGGGSSLMQRIHQTLVPDEGGIASLGNYLSQKGVAHGEKGRDYKPRHMEGTSPASDEESGGQGSEDRRSEGNESD